MTDAELRDRFLVACLITARQKGHEKHFDAHAVATSFALDASRDYTFHTSLDFMKRGLAQVIPGPASAAIRLTNKGVETAEEILRRFPEYGKPLDWDYSPDSWTRFSPEKVKTLEGHLNEMKSIIRNANEIDTEFREILLSEVAAFEATIRQSKISMTLIRRFGNDIIGWMTKKLGEASIGAVAAALTRTLRPF